MAQQTPTVAGSGGHLGSPIDPATKAAAEDLLHETNAAFKREMRALVRSGATEEERWTLIRGAEDAYKAAYFGLTGMNESNLQDIMAGELGRKYPLTQPPTPRELAEQPETPEPDRPRPAAEPPPPPVDRPPEQEGLSGTRRLRQ